MRNIGRLIKLNTTTFPKSIVIIMLYIFVVADRRPGCAFLPVLPPELGTDAENPFWAKPRTRTGRCDGDTPKILAKTVKT